MGLLNVFAVCLLAALVQGRTTGRKDQYAGCLIGLNEHLPKKNEPLLLVRGPNKSLNLALPETEGKYGSVSLRQGEELVVACPGNKNSLLATGQDASQSTCSRDDKVTIKGAGEVSLGELDCKNRAAAALLETKKSCAGGKGNLVEIGFLVETWQKLIEVCHNYEDMQTYYATQVLYGSSLAGKVIQSYRPGFSRGEKSFFKGSNPDALYNQNNQQAVFEELFGAKLASTYLDQKKSFFLARGHLAPDADFLFGTWQLATYFYINVAPQWQSINAGHWLAVENNVRKIATNLGSDLDVATGTYGIMSLPDGKGKMKEVFLEDGKKVPVPELYWKMVMNPRDSSCIGIVATNNPFLEEPPKAICKEVTNSGWPSLQSDLAKGFVYYCSCQDLMKAVVDAPDFKVGGLLKFQ